jgi:hypothetical protein
VTYGYVVTVEIYKEGMINGLKEDIVRNATPDMNLKVELLMSIYLE